jgi:magnesium transporter
LATAWKIGMRRTGGGTDAHDGDRATVRPRQDGPDRPEAGVPAAPQYRLGVIIDCAHYCHGRRMHAEQLTLDRASEIIADESAEGFVWIGAVEPGEAELQDLQQRFGLNELAVEDAQSFHLRPKIELYEDADVLFAVVRSARYDDEHERVTLGEVSILLAPRFVITVRQGSMAALHPARLHLERRPDLLRLGSSAVMWAILDKLVDDYAPVVAGLEQDVDEVEEVVFGGSAAATERIYRLRGQATDFYRAVHPLLGPLESLQRGIYPQIASELIPFFRDINDHLKLVNEEMLGQREALASVLQANMTVISLRQTELGVRQNEAMKTLTIIATIFLPLAFITGFFGMNFNWMTNHIDSIWDFLGFGVGSLVASCMLLWWYFRRAGMLEPGAG